MNKEEFVTFLKILKEQSKFLLENFDEQQFIKLTKTINDTLSRDFFVDYCDEFSLKKIEDINYLGSYVKSKTSYAGKFLKKVAIYRGLIQETDEKEYLFQMITKLDALIMNLEGKLPSF